MEEDETLLSRNALCLFADLAASSGARQPEARSGSRLEDSVLGSSLQYSGETGSSLGAREDLTEGCLTTYALTLRMNSNHVRATLKTGLLGTSQDVLETTKGTDAGATPYVDTVYGTSPHSRTRAMLERELLGSGACFGTSQQVPNRVQLPEVSSEMTLLEAPVLDCPGGEFPHGTVYPPTIHMAPTHIEPQSTLDMLECFRVAEIPQAPDGTLTMLEKALLDRSSAAVELSDAGHFAIDPVARAAHGSTWQVLESFQPSETPPLATLAILEGELIERGMVVSSTLQELEAFQAGESASHATLSLLEAALLDDSSRAKTPSNATQALLEEVLLQYQGADRTGAMSPTQDQTQTQDLIPSEPLSHGTQAMLEAALFDGSSAEYSWPTTEVLPPTPSLPHDTSRIGNVPWRVGNLSRIAMATTSAMFEDALLDDSSAEYSCNFYEASETMPDEYAEDDRVGLTRSDVSLAFMSSSV